MEALFNSVNQFFEFIVPIADFLWDFPTNFEWYKNIPILGNFAFSILFLLGTGVFYTFKTGFVQCKYFKSGIKSLVSSKSSDKGVSPLASFLLSSAMRIGPGNIMGVTGAISVGGPGAVFWMWISAFFGMATSFSEAVLSQIFKEQEGDNYVGGLAFYGKKILGDKRIVGIIISCVFIMYALFSIPGQTFHMITGLVSLAEGVAGQTFDRQSIVYYVVGIAVIVTVLCAVIGGIHGVTNVTDKLVPVMAVIYSLLIFGLILLNIPLIPRFFTEVFGGAFTPKAVFGGAFGIVLAQGIKRGLMSNEAGQGSVTPAAAIAECNHPCEQGFVQSLGVFLDTMVICTMTAFVVVVAQIWSGDSGVVWESIRESKLTVFLTSVQHLVPGVTFDNMVASVVSLCYGLFSFTTIIGLILFAEVSANSISKNRTFIKIIRLIGALFFVPFGVLTVLGGFELGNLWYISDFVAIVMVMCNVPALLIGSKVVLKALKNYENSNGNRFVSTDIGIETECWRVSEVLDKLGNE